MPIALPAPLTAYFTAKNAHDIDAMLAHFAPDAHVRDEGQDYRGAVAIRDWIAHSTSKYAVTVEPESVSSEAEHTIIRALVSGNFPGSPAYLTYRFTLADARIAKLSIG